MSKTKNSKVKVIFLGGVDGIGMNCTAFEYEDDIIIVDCGVAFPEDDMLGIDLVIPEGTKTITLTATAVGSNNGNHTCWAYPRLFGENLNSVKELSLELESDALFIGKAEKTSIIAENYKGEKTLCSSSDIKLYAESDNITVDGSKITATATGKAVVRAEYTVNGTVLKSQTFEIDIFDTPG